jgi:hypothetical protein
MLRAHALSHFVVLISIDVLGLYSFSSILAAPEVQPSPLMRLKVLSRSIPDNPDLIFSCGDSRLVICRPEVAMCTSLLSFSSANS